MKITFFRFFFILLAGGAVIPSFLAASPATTTGAFEKPVLNFTIKKKDAEPDKACYDFQGIGQKIHWNDKIVDVILQGYLKIDAERSILEITSGNITIDGAISHDFSLYLVYSDKLATITYFKTKELILSGAIDFSKNAFLNLDVDIRGINLEDFNKLWGIENFPFEGDFRGKISLKGDVNSILIQGFLEAYHGNLEGYKYEKVFLMFKGTYPWIRFSDSYASIQGFGFNIEGTFNVARLYDLPYDKVGQSPDLPPIRFFDETEQNMIVADSVKGFLALPSSHNLLVYKLDTDSFLRLTPKESIFPKAAPTLEF
ncbi:MAG: hypothetical protein JW734_02680 [Candidatus Omnitrophica bacterium]|nr:hypothetical protein [Candidatus Omnitrophota bacterium]